MQYVKKSKSSDEDWFQVSFDKNDKTMTHWTGKCWYYLNNQRFDFDIEFDIPVTYPKTAFEIAIPKLDGTTNKMYRGGKICLTDHFKPLWARNVPRFGIAHAMALGLGPWLAAETQELYERGHIAPRN